MTPSEQSYPIIEWKRIEEFPEYEVSSDGQVRSWKTNNRPRSFRKQELPYLLALRKSPHDGKEFGRITVGLFKPGDLRTYNRKVHRLVALAFIPNPDNLPEVAHNDGKAWHNEVSNLRWSTRRDNAMDARKHGTMPDGEKCCTCKLKVEQVLEIRRRVALGEVQKHLAEEYGMSRAQISRVVLGRRWKYLGDPTLLPKGSAGFQSGMDWHS